MPLISIRERGTMSSNPVVAIDGQEYPLPGAITPPFDAQMEEQLEWYFEEHLRFPFIHQVRAQTTAASIKTYGETLFNQIFRDPDNPDIYADYRAATREGLENLTFEIAGSPAFQSYHWEALWDPKLPQPFSLQSPFVRRNLQPQTMRARVRTSPTINVLVVTARPGVARDVGYRTIARPLVESLRQAAVPVAIDLLRPGSYAALSAHLEEKQDQQGAGYYHVIHFDLHGGLLTFDQFDALEQQLETSQHTFQAQRFGRGELARYEGVKAFLMLESGVAGIADPVEATELAKLLLIHQIPIAILNACQSGKQIGATETSLGSQLMSAGMQMVLAMGYSVTVSAAEIMMAQLYQQLFQKGDLAAAIRSARLELHNRKGRRAYFNQTINLEDWLLPVVYQNQPQQLTTRDFTEAESNVYYERAATRYPEPHVTYGFVGRDLDILHIEQRLLRQEQGRDQNLLLVRGMGGAGKSTLLRHLAYWWQATGLVDQVAYFGYDERAWTLQQILDDLARQLLDERNYSQFQPLSLAAQAQLLARHLRATRHLLILDNLESITGSNLAILNTLPAAEQRVLQGFLRELAGGKTLVLLGSRGPEAWLAPGTFDTNLYLLPGLDPEAASTLTDRILTRHGATSYRSDPAMQQDLQRLITLLDGHPLALEVVLANLAKQTPAQVLAALQSGAGKVEINQGVGDADQRTKAERTTSILACIAYSHSNLSPATQQLLLCLAPFTGVINREWLPQYTAQLQAQPALAALPYDRWDEVLDEAINWGLLTVDAQLPMYLRIQPIFPYFLRTRLQYQESIKIAVDIAFSEYYNNLGKTFDTLIQPKEAEKRERGMILVRYEYENLANSIDLALQNALPFYGAYGPLHSFLNIVKNPQRILEISQKIISTRDAYAVEQLAGDIGRELFLVYSRLGTAYLELREYDLAYQTHNQSILTIKNSQTINDKMRVHYEASAYHNLGLVAMEQQMWAIAEEHYQQALTIKTDLNDGYSQADTYHNLGIVAQQQRHWAQAEAYYKQAIAIKIEFNDRYSQAGTYGQLGHFAMALRQWKQAEYYLKECLKIDEDFNNRHRQAQTHHNLGVVAYEQQEWKDAEKHYQDALKLYISIKDRYSQAHTYHQLGMLMQILQQWMEAEGYYQHALTLYTEFNVDYEKAATYHQLGMLMQILQQWIKAEGYYQHALTLFIEAGDRHNQARVYNQLSAVAYERQQWVQVTKYLLQALQVFIEVQDQSAQGITLRNLARLYHVSGDNTLPAAVADILGVESAAVTTFFSRVQAAVDE